METMSLPRVRFNLVWSRYGIFIVLLFAFALQFYRLDARTFHGDELGSVVEAYKLGLNANSLPYFALLRVWLVLGDGEFWLRSLSALAAVGTVGLTYAWVRKLGGAPTARAAALLLATSPFLVVYGQQVRFYTVGLVAAGLCVWTFVALLDRVTPRTLIAWALSSLVAVAALLMNGLLLLGEAVTLFVLSRSPRPRVKWVIIIAVILVGVGLIANSAVRAYAFAALAYYTNAQAHYVVSRGLALTQFAKIPLTFFFFIFGESVYPLTFALVVPGGLLFGLAAIAGGVRLWQNQRAFWLAVATGSIALSLMYLVFDPLAPPGLQGAAPRYLIFLLPIFVLIVASSAQGKLSWFIVPLLLVNFGSLASYWYGDWAYTDDLVNWRAVTQWVSDYVTPQSAILLDGPSLQMASQYFSAEWNQQGWNDQSLSRVANNDGYSRIILLSFSWHPDERVLSTAGIAKLAARYTPTAVWEKYPLFVYVYDRKRGTPDTYRVDASTGQVSLPTEIYGLEFQDLRLPIPLSVKGRTVESLGAFGLPGLAGQTTRTLALEQPTTARQIWLMSDVTGANPAAGATLAILRVTGADGSTQTFPLRAGIETSAWNSQCQPAACTVAYTWRKRLALVGAESYPGSWQEFDASIFATQLTLSNPMSIQSLEVERSDTQGTLYVWGLVLQ